MIEFDIEGMVRQLRGNLNQARRELPRIAEEEGNFVLDKWRLAAEGTFYPGMSRPFYSDHYKMALARSEVVQSPTGAEVHIYNRGSVDFGRGYAPFDYALMVETGRPSVDLKEAVRRGTPKTRITKDGRHYLIVPFRFGTGESAHFKANVSPQVRDFVGRFGSISERRRPSGVRNPWMAAQMAQETRSVSGPHTIIGIGPRVARDNGYTWARHMLMGLKRFGDVGQHRFMTFRTITPTMDPGAWILPAIAPNPIFASVVRAVEPLVRQHIEEKLRRR